MGEYGRTQSQSMQLDAYQQQMRNFDQRIYNSQSLQSGTSMYPSLQGNQMQLSAQILAHNSNLSQNLNSHPSQTSLSQQQAIPVGQFTGQHQQQFQRAMSPQNALHQQQRLVFDQQRQALYTHMQQQQGAIPQAHFTVRQKNNDQQQYNYNKSSPSLYQMHASPASQPTPPHRVITVHQQIPSDSDNTNDQSKFYSTSQPLPQQQQPYRPVSGVGGVPIVHSVPATTTSNSNTNCNNINSAGRGSTTQQLRYAFLQQQQTQDFDIHSQQIVTGIQQNNQQQQQRESPHHFQHPQIVAFHQQQQLQSSSYSSPALRQALSTPSPAQQQQQSMVLHHHQQHSSPINSVSASAAASFIVTNGANGETNIGNNNTNNNGNIASSGAALASRGGDHSIAGPPGILLFSSSSNNVTNQMQQQQQISTFMPSVPTPHSISVNGGVVAANRPSNVASSQSQQQQQQRQFPTIYNDNSSPQIFNATSTASGIVMTGSYMATSGDVSTPPALIHRSSGVDDYSLRQQQQQGGRFSSPSGSTVGPIMASATNYDEFSPNQQQYQNDYNSDNINNNFNNGATTLMISNNRNNNNNDSTSPDMMIIASTAPGTGYPLTTTTTTTANILLQTTAMPSSSSSLQQQQSSNRVILVPKKSPLKVTGSVGGGLGGGTAGTSTTVPGSTSISASSAKSKTTGAKSSAAATAMSTIQARPLSAETARENTAPPPVQKVRIIEHDALDAIVKNIDPSTALESDVSDALTLLIGNFIDDVLTGAAELCDHKGSKKLDVKDIKYVMSGRLGAVSSDLESEAFMNGGTGFASGFSSASKRPSLAAHHQRLALIDKLLKSNHPP